jgi:NADPH-dependent curcumin reductase CurA
MGLVKISKQRAFPFVEQSAVLPLRERIELRLHANRIVISSPGPASVLRYEQHDIAAQAPHEVLIRQTAIGLNYIDIQHRTGRYPLPCYPSPIGMEGAGIIDAIGDEVYAFEPGDRVVYSSMPIGAYADLRLMPADRLVPLPPTIPDSFAAGIFTKGITAHYLIFTTFAVKAGDAILVHAAAGGEAPTGPTPRLSCAGDRTRGRGRLVRHGIWSDTCFPSLQWPRSTSRQERGR